MVEIDKVGKTVVGLVATGGTIGNSRQGRLSIEEVLEDIRLRATASERETLQHVDGLDLLQLGGDAIGIAEWLTIGRAVDGFLSRDDVVGVVLTHGTYTLEETAFFLHLTSHTSKPIVVTCSQRQHGLVGNDGDRNLIDAIRVARAPDARGCGVLVVEAESIHSAREVTKTSQRPGGFVSSMTGPIGSVAEDDVSVYARPTRRHTDGSRLNRPSSSAEWPRIDVVSVYVGADDVAITAYLNAGSQGLVIDGFSFRGWPAPAQRAALYAAADRGIPIALANRGRVGRIPVTSGGAFLSADDLQASKARILLGLSLNATQDLTELQDIFNSY